MEETIESKIVQLNEYKQNVATLEEKVKEKGVEMSVLQSSFGNEEEESGLVRVENERLITTTEKFIARVISGWEQK